MYKRKKTKQMEKKITAKELATQAAQIYYNPMHPAAFGGVEPLWRALKGRWSRLAIKKWLASQWTYSLHRPARVKGYLTRPTRTHGIDHQWQADLVEMGPYAKDNGGYRYILMAIDVFSRYGWAQPLKNKTSGEVIRGLEAIFKGPPERKPFSLQTDEGKEFENKPVREFLIKRGPHPTKQFSVKSAYKASMVERLNWTIKTKMWRVFTREGHRRWVSLLPQLMVGYNASRHRIIGMAPAEVNKLNASEL